MKVCLHLKVFRKNKTPSLLYATWGSQWGEPHLKRPKNSPSTLQRASQYLQSNASDILTIVPLFQNESKCESFHMKMSSACSFIFEQIKVIFVLRLALRQALENLEMAFFTHEFL